MSKEIGTLDDIRLLVDSFYAKVRTDDTLGGIFNLVIGDHWAAHLDKMYCFWQTILLGEHTYTGNPFAPHADMLLRQEHFKRWVKLFTETVDELFHGEVAEDAKWRATKMAQVFQYRITGERIGE